MSTLPHASNVRTFARATRRAARLRMALAGGPGSGKTFSALSIAKWLPGPIAVIDSETGSASKYADDPGLGVAFDVLELDRHAPQDFTAAIQEAARLGYGTLVIDSLSHAWMGNDGALEQVDRLGTGANKFTAWAQVTPAHNEMIRSILSAPMHVIVTMRTKMAYALEANDRGKLEPRKLGLQPVQRDGVEYEFDVVGDLNEDHILRVTKSRCSRLDGRAFRKPGREVAEELLRWLDAGDAPPAAVFAPASPPPAPPRFVDAAPSAQAIQESVAAFMTPQEQDLVAKYTKRFVDAKELSELKAVCQICVREAGGVKASPAFQRWYVEAKKVAEAAIGGSVESGPGPAKAPPPPPPAAPGAQMPTQRAVSR